MKEFLILKKVSANSLNGVNCAVKLNFEKSLNVSGEIYVGANFDSEFKVYLVSGVNSIELASGVLKFEREVDGEFLNGGYVIVLDKTEGAVLYGTYKNANFSLQDAMDIITSKKQEYNDDEIATENYYEGEFYETERIYNQLDGGDSQDKEKPQKEEAGDGAILYENVAKKSENFYDRIREKLQDVISSHKKDEELSSVIPNGEFCKICYDNDRYYSVGRVFEGERVKYVCYAVKGDYTKTPQELKKFCKFIPKSSFSPLSSGYYVIFQDAETGEIVEN